MPLELTLTPDHVTVEAGQSAEIEVAVRNTGDAEETYTVEVVGLDESVYRFPTTSAIVPAGGLTALSLVLCPPAGGNIRTATYSFRIRAGTSRKDQATATARITIEPALALKVELIPAGGNRFDVSLQSEANRELEILLRAEDVRGTDPARGCDYLLEQPVVKLAAGQRYECLSRCDPVGAQFWVPAELIHSG